MKDLDIIIRENTEGMYSGLGQKVSEDSNSAEAMSNGHREGAQHICHLPMSWHGVNNAKKSRSYIKPTS